MSGPVTTVTLRRLAMLAGIAVLALPAAASAASPSNGDLLNGFNAILNNGASTNTIGTESEGALLLGGNFAGITNVDFNGGVGTPGAASLSGYGAINVYGNSTGSSNTSGKVYIHGTSTGSFQNAAQVSVGYNFPYTFTSLYTQLTALSTSLKSLATTAGTSFNSSTDTISATPTTVNGVSGISVLNITGQQLQSISSNGPISLNGTQLLIINVDTANTSGVVTSNTVWNPQGYASNVIWNFFDATGNLVFNTEFGGTVLAPTGTLQAPTYDGTVVAQNATIGGELHYYGIGAAGQSFVNTFTSGATTTPEPATFAVLGSGLVALAALRRRIRRIRR